MSKYQELVELAAEARKEMNERETRCRRAMLALVNGLAFYCEIPVDRIEFWKLSESGETFQRGEDGMRFTVPGAMVQDEDGFWQVGVRINLTPSSAHSLFTVLCLSEQNGKTVVKLGNKTKPKQIEVNNPDQCREFYDEIIEKAKESLRYQSSGGKDISSSIGFSFTS